MDLKLVRFLCKPETTLGALFIDEAFECYSLEDAVRETKIPGRTAIPMGQYFIDIDMSSRFKRLMPHVLAVPGFVGVRIHSGNTNTDTEGCILVGLTQHSDPDYLGSSHKAFEQLFQKLYDAQQAIEPITITISKE